MFSWDWVAEERVYFCRVSVELQFERWCQNLFSVEEKRWKGSAVIKHAGCTTKGSNFLGCWSSALVSCCWHCKRSGLLALFPPFFRFLKGIRAKWRWNSTRDDYSWLHAVRCGLRRDLAPQGGSPEASEGHLKHPSPAAKPQLRTQRTLSSFNTSKRQSPHIIIGPQKDANASEEAKAAKTIIPRGVTFMRVYIKCKSQQKEI
jgi:hypothetical protein